MENDTAEYFYPPDEFRLTSEELELAGGLSSSHAVGEIVPLDVNPEQYKAQGAFRVDSTPLATEGLEFIAKDVYPHSDEVLASLQTGEQSDNIHKIGELLAAGYTVMDTIPHSTISDIGLGHGLPAIALRNLGYEFRSAMVVSQGVTRLSREYHGQIVPVPDYLSYMCDTTWFVYPNTDKTAKSELVKNVPPEKLKGHNSIVKDDMKKEQAGGGLLITSAVNATSYILGKNGEHLLAGITPGTIETMTQRRTRVQKVIVELMELEEPVFEFCGEPLDLKTPDEAHELVGQGMAHDLGLALPDQQFIYLDPRHGLTQEDFQ